MLKSQLPFRIQTPMYVTVLISYDKKKKKKTNLHVKVIHTRSVFLAGMFACLAVGAGISNLVQTISFSVVGENLTFRMRGIHSTILSFFSLFFWQPKDRSFRSILRQNIAWFDEEKNATGVLATKLATGYSSKPSPSHLTMWTQMQQWCKLWARNEYLLCYKTSQHWLQAWSSRSLVVGNSL